MAVSGAIPEWFKQVYTDDVHEAFQQKGSKAMNTVRVETVAGTTVDFRRAGKGTATTKARHGTVPTMGINYDAVTATMVDYYAGDWVDKLDELKHRLNERQTVANAGAYALGRKVDTLIYTALNALSSSALTLTNALTVRNGLIEMRSVLDGYDVPDDGNVWCPCPPRLWNWLMVIPEFASSDYTGPELPYRGAMGQAIKTWNRTNFFMASPNVVPKSSNDRSIFMYHSTAVGLGKNEDINVDITWHGDRAAHFVNHWMSMGAVVIDDEGCVKRTLDESGALPTS
jgi:hypothetical protein